MTSIYFDHNATTPIAPEVAEAMARAQREFFANPASQHRAGRKSRRALEDAREGIARLLGAAADVVDADRLLFTSGGTEANNLALHGLGNERLAAGQRGKIIVSAIEHPSILETATSLPLAKTEAIKLGVDANGIVDLARLRELLASPTRLVSIMFGNNETGVLQPIAEISALCRAAEVPLHIDAVQAVGKIAVDFHRSKAAAMTVTAHKLNGPIGIGALLVRHGVKLSPMLHGGQQQFGLRPGTESVALAVGFHEALRQAISALPERTAQLQKLRDRLEALLRAGLPNLVVNSAGAARLPHTTSVSLPGVDRQQWLLALDAAGVACSSGSACASGSSEPSHVLQAMGCSKEIVGGAIRFSLGSTTTAEEIETAAERIIATGRKMVGH